jgi:hypothetical protein
MKYFTVALAMVVFLLKDHKQSNAAIISAQTIQQIQIKIEDLLKDHNPENILVAFDIDMTLTQPDHPALYYPALKKHLALYQKILAPLTPEQKDLAITLTTQMVPQRLIESQTPKTVQALQQKGIKVIALTASLTGKFDGFKDKMIFLRRDQLQKLGIDFTKSLSKWTSVISFMDFPQYTGWYPMFYHGVLSSNGEKHISKGQVLGALLQHVGSHYPKKVGKPGYSPHVIVFIDDKKKHLEEVESYLKSHHPNLPFVGIEYQAAFDYAPTEIGAKDFEKFWNDLTHKAKSLLNN